MTAALGFQHGASSDYAKIDTYLRLQKSFTQLARLADTTANVLLWADRDKTAADAQKNAAQQIRQLAKSKYDDTVWLAKVTPMQDEIRERKRDALIGYLVETSLRTVEPEIVQGTKRYANPAYWRDANDLLNYFLIDVEMSSCQLTSRIKQAISSTQMFVQRCLLGLEQPRCRRFRARQPARHGVGQQLEAVEVDEELPGLGGQPQGVPLPGKLDRARAARRQVAVLRGAGERAPAERTSRTATPKPPSCTTCRRCTRSRGSRSWARTTSWTTPTPYDNLPPNINRLHVIGRTRAHPAVYYYRTFDLNYGEWTAWEKIDLDIQSDQVIPGRLQPAAACVLARTSSRSRRR